MHLLLIEDDEETAGFVAAGLRARGHSVDRHGDGIAGLAAMLACAADVAILDRMLPGKDGLAVVAEARAAGCMVPVLMLTALGAVEDRVAGLQGGADDYLTKPFSMAELEARVEALARRVTSAAPTRLTIDDLVLDRLAREVTRGGERIELQPREFQLLELLMLQAPHVVTRKMLLQRVWRFAFDPGTNIVESHISRLRSKIDRGGDRPIITTVRGEGYAARLG